MLKSVSTQPTSTKVFLSFILQYIRRTDHSLKSTVLLCAISTSEEKSFLSIEGYFREIRLGVHYLPSHLILSFNYYLLLGST